MKMKKFWPVGVLAATPRPPNDQLVDKTQLQIKAIQKQTSPIDPRLSPEK